MALSTSAVSFIRKLTPDRTAVVWTHQISSETDTEKYIEEMSRIKSDPDLSCEIFQVVSVIGETFHMTTWEGREFAIPTIANEVYADQLIVVSEVIFSRGTTDPTGRIQQLASLACTIAAGQVYSGTQAERVADEAIAMAELILVKTYAKHAPVVRTDRKC